MLEFTYTKKEDIPSGAEDHYKETSDGWVLDLTGAPDKTEDIRRLTRSLDGSRSELRELKDKFKGVDLAEYQQLREQAEKIRDKKLIDEGKLEELLRAKLDPVEKDHARIVQEKDERYSKLLARVNKLEIENPATKALTAHGIDPRNLKYGLAEVMERFDVGENGEIEGRDREGNLITNSKGARASIDDFVREYLATSDTTSHLFKAPATSRDVGAGASGTGNSGRQDANGVRHLPFTNENFSKYIKEIAEGKVVLDA